MFRPKYRPKQKACIAYFSKTWRFKPRFWNKSQFLDTFEFLEKKWFHLCHRPKNFLKKWNSLQNLNFTDTVKNCPSYLWSKTQTWILEYFCYWVLNSKQEIFLNPDLHNHIKWTDKGSYSNHVNKIWGNWVLLKVVMDILSELCVITQI